MEWHTIWEAIQAADPYAVVEQLELPYAEVRAPAGRAPRVRRLFRLGGTTASHAYVLAQAAGHGAGGAPRPFTFYWAPSDGAALRVAYGRPEADDGARGEPPAELLIEPGLLSRAAVQAWVHRHQPRYVEEGFAGFSPRTGAYVRVGRLVYHFRSIRWDPEERPFAIEYDPRPVGPLFQGLASFQRPGG